MSSEETEPFDPERPARELRELLPGEKLTYSATGLPPGLSVDPETGAITGVPAAPGSYRITVTATGG